MGIDSRKSEEGEWECRLEAVTQTGAYVDASEKFQVQFLRPASISVSVVGDHDHQNQQVNTYPGEEIEVSCEARDGLPEPRVKWFLNRQEIDFSAPQFRERFSLESEDGPRLSSSGGWSHLQTIRYTAGAADNGMILQCATQQFDDEGTPFMSEPEHAKYFLSIKEMPVTASGVSMGCLLYTSDAADE